MLVSKSRDRSWRFRDSLGEVPYSLATRSNMKPISERMDDDMAFEEEEMQNVSQPSEEEFPSLEEEDPGWGLRDEGQGRARDISGTAPPSRSIAAIARRHNMSPEQYVLWQRGLDEKTMELGATQAHPDVNMPTTARQLGNMPPPLTTTMGADSDIPLPAEMGNFKRPIIRRAFDHAMSMLESRYFG